MSEVRAVFTGDASPAIKALDQLRINMRSTEAFARKLNFSPGGGSGGGRNTANMGAMAMQVQDIAVQLQAGTQLSTVLTQQGSQLASIFGPRGALIGGMIGVTGLAYNLAKASKDAFAELISGSTAAAAQINAMAASGAGIEKITTSLANVNKIAEELAASRSAEKSASGFILTSLGTLMGGESTSGKLSRIRLEEARMEQARATAGLAAVEAGRTDLQIAQLRADGRKEEADALERAAALASRIRQIESSGHTEQAKTILIEQAKAQAKLADDSERRAKADKIADDNRERQTKYITSIGQLRQQLAADKTAGATGKDRLMLLNKEMQEMRNNAVLNGYSTSESDINARQKKGDFAGAEKSLRWLLEYNRLLKETEGVEQQLKKEAIEASKANADKAKAAEDATNALEGELALANKMAIINAATATARAAVGRAATLTDMATTGQLNNLRAHGRDRAAEKLESRIAEDQKKRALMDAGMKEADAARAAQQLQRDEDRAAGRRVTIGRRRGTRADGQDILNQAAQAAQNQAAQAARNNKVSFVEAAEMIAELKAIAAKLTFAN